MALYINMTACIDTMKGDVAVGIITIVVKDRMETEWPV